MCNQMALVTRGGGEAEGPILFKILWLFHDGLHDDPQ